MGSTSWAVKGLSKRAIVPQTEQLLGSNIIGGPRIKVRVRRMVFYCPDGSDPGIPANTDTVYVGPNRTSDFPIQPGAWTEMQDINPWDVAIRCATSNQLVFFHFGGGIVGEE